MKGPGSNYFRIIFCVGAGANPALKRAVFICSLPDLFSPFAFLGGL